MILNRKTRQGRRIGHAAAIIGVVMIACLLLPRDELAASLQDTGISAKTPEAGPPAILAMRPRAQEQAPVVPTVGQAQSVTTTLSGRVSDQTGAVIPGATVTLSSGQRRLSVITNESGAYTFPQVEPGAYALDVSLPGFRSTRFSNFQIAGASQQNVTLQVGTLSTNVEVRAARAPDPPPPAPPPGGPVRIGGDIAQANLIYSPRPTYPASMRAGGIEGVVLIQAIIGTDGTIVDPRIISGHPELSTAALDAVKQWCYRPTLLNGMPVDAVTIITINFSLSD